jgi:hypothetical protein
MLHTHISSPTARYGNLPTGSVVQQAQMSLVSTLGE